MPALSLYSHYDNLTINKFCVPNFVINFLKIPLWLKLLHLCLQPSQSGVLWGVCCYSCVVTTIIIIISSFGFSRFVYEPITIPKVMSITPRSMHRSNWNSQLKMETVLTFQENKRRQGIFCHWAINILKFNIWLLIFCIIIYKIPEVLLLVFHFFLSKMIYLDEDKVNWNYQHELCSSNPVKVLNNLSASIAAGLIFSFIFFLFSFKEIKLSF